MTNVRAGVAYVDVRLGSIEKLKSAMKSEIESATREVGKRVGEELAKSATPGAAKAGVTTSKAMSSAFFKDAKQSMMGGFRALSQFNIQTFGKMMLQAGAAGALGIRTGVEAGIKGFLPTLERGLTGAARIAGNLAVGIGSKIVSGFKAIPGAMTTASNAINAFSRRMGLLSFQMTNFGFIALTAFTAPVAAALTLGAVIGIKTAASIEQATAALKALTPAGTNVEALIKRLQNLAQKSPIFNTADVISFTQKMVASGLSVKQTEAFLKSFGNIALTVGADVSKVPFALEALVQMVGKGKVQMEELRQQLGDALPGAMKIVSDALGVTTADLYEMTKAGKITGTDLVIALTKLGQSPKYLKGATNGVDTLGSKFQALKESISNQLGQVFLDNADKIKSGIDKLGPSLSKLIQDSGPAFNGLINGFQKLVDWIGKAIDWYDKLSPQNQKLFKIISLITIALGPAVLIFGALGSAIAGITALVSVLISPVGAVVVGIIALGAAVFGIIKYLQNAYKEGGKFKEIWDKVWDSVMKLLEPLKKQWNEVWTQIKEGWAQLSAAFMENKQAFLDILKIIGVIAGVIAAVVVGVLFAAIKGVLAAIGPLFKAIASLISGIMKILGGVIDFIVGVWTGDWGRAWDGIKKIWDGLWDAIIGTITNIIGSIWALVKGFVTGIGDFFSWLYNLLVGHSIIPDMVNAILGWFRKLVDLGKSIISNLGAYFSAFYNIYIAPFVNAVRNGIEKAVSFFTSIPGKIKNAFSSAGSWLVNAGRNIVDGLVEGVKRMSGVLKSAILNLIPGPVKSIVAKALDINSPSKVFKKYGQYVVQGFIDGIKDMTPKMINQMQKFSSIIPETATTNFGTPQVPLVTPGNASKGAALNIENYYANANADPRRQAEDWYFLVSARGGNA
jgi:tape measure domain-containing protein